MFSAGYWLVYQCNREAIRQQMTQAIAAGQFSSAAIVSIRLSPFEPSAFHDFELVEENEIRLNGQMFDIVQLRWQKNCLLLDCVADKAETDLIANYNRFLEEQTAGLTGLKTVKLLKFSFPLFIPGHPAALRQPVAAPAAGAISAFLHASIPLQLLKIPSPPPRV